MKTIIILVVAVLTIGSANAAGLGIGSEERTRFYVAEEKSVFNPSSVLKSYSKSALETISENNKIIGGEEELTAHKRTTEEIMAADLQITEGNLPECAPLSVKGSPTTKFCKSNLLLN